MLAKVKDQKNGLSVYGFEKGLMGENLNALSPNEYEGMKFEAKYVYGIDGAIDIKINDRWIRFNSADFEELDLTENLTVYMKSDIGCYIDGALGHDHAMARMLELLEGLAFRVPDEYQQHKNISDLIYEAEKFDTENNDADYDASYEWLDDATNVLNDATQDGLIWLWNAGDLILTDESEAE